VSFVLSVVNFQFLRVLQAELAEKVFQEGYKGVENDDF
jgi:hypothetical protein